MFDRKAPTRIGPKETVVLLAGLMALNAFAVFVTMLEKLPRNCDGKVA